MRLNEIDALDATRTWWVPAVVSPCRDWPGVPGSRKGARYLIDRATRRPSRDRFEAFDSQLSCQAWIVRHRASLTRTLPGAAVKAVPLDRWVLGLE